MGAPGCSDKLVRDALDSLNDYVRSRVAFLQVVFRDFEGGGDVLGAEGDSDTVRADQGCSKVGICHGWSPFQLPKAPRSAITPLRKTGL